MGIFKDNLNLGLQYAFLINLGFKYEKSNGINGMSGYVKSINHNEIEVLWITVNPQERKVHLYNEWDCGGELWQREYDIPQNVLESESEFVDWLDIVYRLIKADMLESDIKERENNGEK